MSTGWLAHVLLFLSWFGVLTLAVAITYLMAIRPWHLRWGATDEEASQYLPGDDLVLLPQLQATHAVTIRASAAAIWPWLVQMGQGRGGLYSYDWLENLMGLDIHSVNRVLPEHQNLKVGDVIPLEPGGTGPPVVAIDPCRALVLGGTMNADPGPRQSPFVLKDKNPNAYMSVSWVFVLNPIDAQTTRLIERFRLDWTRGFKYTLPNRVILEPISFIMERKMLLGIKRRVETLAKFAAPAPAEHPEQSLPVEERKAS